MSLLIETLLEEAFVAIERARSGTLRQFQFPAVENMIKVAIGMRRSGKTYFLYQTIHQLLDAGVSKEQILFVNFEDDRLLPMNAEQMGQLLDSFYSLYPANYQRRCYIFLDEVQNVEDWHLTVRRYFDSKNVQLYLSGSSAKLLSKEINTSLRGRSLSVEIFPYNFSEYLSAHKAVLPEKPFGQAAFDLLRQQLVQYFSIGGFPAVQMMPQKERQEALQGYVDAVILKDIIERYKVTNVSLLKYLVGAILKNIAASFAINKFYNDVKSQGYQVGKETIYNYMEYLQDAFLIFSVPYYSESGRIRQNKPKKIYAIDSGLVNAMTFNIDSNYGKFLENLVCLDLRRQGKSVYFYSSSDGYEVDFVTVDREGQRELIQVTWDLSDVDTMEREERALVKAEKELGIKGKIVTARDYLSQYTRSSAK